MNSPQKKVVKHQFYELKIFLGECHGYKKKYRKKINELKKKISET